MAHLHHPDLVLLDLMMPKMGGAEALPRILEAAPAAKVAVLTGLDSDRLDSEAMSGAAGCFQKSAGIEGIVEQLAALFCR